MAFKFVTLFALIALANAGGFVTPVTYATSPLIGKIVNHSADAVATTQQNVVRSFGGTVSSYSKSEDTPYSSVRKTDTRINNNVYTPAVTKTVTYAAPAPTASVYTAHGPAVYAAPTHSQTVYAAPAKTVYSAPALTNTIYSQQSPVIYSNAAPVVAKTVYSQHAPVVYSHAAPTVAKTVTYSAPAATTTVNHGPAATTYTHNAPGVTGYGTSQTIHYSPAEMVSHMTFDGFGTHWGF